MLKEAHSLTDTPMSTIKTKMDIIARSTLSQVRVLQGNSLPRIPIFLSMQFSDLNMVMLKQALTHLFFGKHNLEILQTAHKL